jgi:hypothetical protein
MNEELFFRPLEVSDLQVTKPPKAAPTWIGKDGAFQFLGELAMSGSLWVPKSTGILSNVTKREAGIDEIGLVVRSSQGTKLLVELADRLGMPVSSVPATRELIEALLVLRFGNDFENFSKFYERIGAPLRWGTYHRIEMENNWPKDLWPLFDLARRLPPVLRLYYTCTRYVFGGDPVQRKSEPNDSAIRSAFDSLDK